MDPTACLQRIRDAYPILGGEYTPGENVDHDAIVADAAHAARDLDEWLSKGGFLPQPWQR